jgi:hypothetical protein
VAAFEADEKRKLAMLKKRVEAVEPVLHKGVNEQAYMGLVKTVYHDVGSGYLDLFECKYVRHPHLAGTVATVVRDVPYRQAPCAPRCSRPFSFLAVGGVGGSPPDSPRAKLPASS